MRVEQGLHTPTNRERSQLMSRIEAHEEAERQGDGMKDRVVLLEAELERVSLKLQDCVGELAAAQLMHKEQMKQIQGLTARVGETASAGKSVASSLRGLVQKLFGVTQQILPSFQRVAVEDNATAPQLTAVLHDTVAFLSEVTRARGDAVQMVREKMKQQLLDATGKLALMEEKEAVLQQSLQLADENTKKEQDVHRAKLEEMERKYGRDAGKLEDKIAAVQVSLREAQHEVEIMRLENDSLGQTVAGQVELISACEERLTKEAAARAHLQKMAAEEAKKRLVLEKQVVEMKVQLKLCGAGDATLREEDLVAMVTQLTSVQGALEVENCSLRDKLQKKDTLGLGPEDGKSPVLLEQLEAAIEDEYADDALTQILLRRNLGAQKTSGS
eukprot:TRINITY_DN9645_c1_g3_i3.p1 TRINITY_DN9645_c1_g3~~TRINITY_DN9645_c1_g3_i3.p1  ORF type:complete len:387 (+),score=147.98 TRINITY_DN9645_c1_g3_i3:693-1853(+)